MLLVSDDNSNQKSTNTKTITYTFDDGNSVIQTYDSEQNLLDEKTGAGIRANLNPNTNTNDDRANVQKAGIANATSLVFAQQPSTHSQSKDQAGTNAKHNDTNPIILSLDKFGRLDTLTLPQGSTYTRQYDDFGRLIAHTDANTGTHRLSHNTHHLPTLIQDENTTTAIAYNDLAMPTKRQTCQTQKTNTSKTEQSNQAQDCQTVSYHYDNKHRPTTINDQHQNTTYVYDDKGNVIKTEVLLTTTKHISGQNTNQSQQANHQNNQTHTTAYQYDSLGRITHTHLPEGVVLTHHYDKHSQTTHIDYQLPSTSVWQTLTRSLRGNESQNPLLSNIKASSTQGLVSFTHTNNTSQVNVYDQQDRLTTKHDHTTSTKLSYGINSNNPNNPNNPNNLSQIVSIDTNGNIINIDELTNAYTYDSNGNRTKHHNTHYTYEPNSDRLSRIENDNTIITYQYDSLGNPITITTTNKQDNSVNTRTLTYTPDGQIKSIKDTLQDKQGNQTEKLIATYQYNHLRQRIAKTTYHQDDKTGQTKEETTQYLWDKGLLSAEIKDNKITRRYVYLDVMPVAVLDYTYNQKGKLDKTEVYSIHTDHLGTPKAVSDKDKNIVWQIDLDTFGETKSIESKNNFQFNLRFAGQYFDTETGYHYNYHRYYDPKVGRYLTSDPIGLNGGSLNTYAYVGNESWGVVDPWGLYAVGVWDKKQGIDIIIPVLFTHRANEFAEKIQHWKRVVEKTYTGRFGDFSIKTKVDLINKKTSNNYKTINKIAIKYDSECNQEMELCTNHLMIDKDLLINSGIFYTSASDNTIAHEFGHMLGIYFDPYFSVPFKQPFSRWHNVMGNSLSYKHADWLMFSVILDSKAFDWQGCKPLFEKYNPDLDQMDFSRRYDVEGK